jgi:hypothetical protein
MVDERDTEPLDYAPVEPPRRRWDAFRVPRMATWLIVFGPLALGLIALLAAKIIGNMD